MGKVRYKRAGVALDRNSIFMVILIMIIVTVIVIVIVIMTVIMTVTMVTGRVVVPGRLGVVTTGASQIEGGIALVEGIVDLLQDKVLVVLVVSVACQSAAPWCQLSIGHFAGWDWEREREREPATLPQDGERSGGGRCGLKHPPRRSCMATAGAASVSTFGSSRAVRWSSVLVTFWALIVGRAATAATAATAAAAPAAAAAVTAAIAAAAAAAVAVAKVLGAGLGLHVVCRAELIVVCPASGLRLPSLVLVVGAVEAGS